MTDSTGTRRAKDLQEDPQTLLNDSINDLKGSAAEAAHRVKEQAAQLAQGAVDAVDEKRAPAARALRSAASTLHDQADAVTDGAQSVAKFAHKAADKLDRTADYVRDNDARTMMDDTKTFVKQHPRASLIAAAAFGFVIGRMAWRKRE